MSGGWVCRAGVLEYQAARGTTSVVGMQQEGDIDKQDAR